MKRVTVVVTLGGNQWSISDKHLRRLQRAMMSAAHDECDDQDHEIIAIQSKLTQNAKAIKPL